MQSLHIVVRAGLVGTVTAAATPLFPVVGAYRLAAHVVPARGARLAVFGSACGVASFAARDALPAIVDHAELVAPLAVAIGVAAAVAYGVLEAALGGPRPLLDAAARLLPRAAPAWLVAAGPPAAVGAAVGLCTAVAAPYAYVPLFCAHFGVDAPGALSAGRAWDRLLPVTAPTGVVAGAVLGPVLRPAILGVPGVRWTLLALPAAGLAAAACAALYRGAAEPPVVAEADDLRTF